MFVKIIYKLADILERIYDITRTFSRRGKNPRDRA